MNYDKEYTNALERAKEISGVDYAGTPHKEIVEHIFPELAESENERIRKALIEYFDELKRLDIWANGYHPKTILAWLEKQKPVEHKPKIEKKEATGVLKQLIENQKREEQLVKRAYAANANSFINYLDAHLYEGKMCVSNGECKDIEDAFKNADWGKIGRYYNKFIQKPSQRIISAEAKESLYTTEDVEKLKENYEEKRNHPFATFTIEEFDAEKEKVEKKVVNKAKKWLSENLDRYDESIGWTKDEFIENFLKDMKL